MKKLISVAIIVALLSGCATQTPAYVMQKKNSRQAIEKIRNVEIFYHADDDYTVVDRGGSGMTGMAGLLGPVGLLVALGADAGSKMTVAERAKERTKEFSSAMRSSLPDGGLNAQFANKLADLLRESGRTVKLTQIERPSGSERLAASTAKNLNLTEDFAPVVLRITAGFGAESATSSYKPFVAAEYVLKNTAGNVLVENRETINNDSKTYMTYQGLLEDHKEAGEMLRKDILLLALVAHKKLFDLSELSEK